VEAVRKAGRVLIGFSPAMQERSTELHRFLRKHLYEHPHVQEMTGNAAEMVTGLFEAYFKDISCLPPEFAARAEQEQKEKGASGKARIVADYVAGMTDRFATKEYQKLNMQS
jgi:dGTPase